MPLLTYFNNMWYGSASGAMVGDTPVIGITASAKMDKRLAAFVDGTTPEPYLKMTRALKQTLLVDACGELILALPKKKLKGACNVSIGAVPSAFDIAQSVWQANNTQYNATGTMGAKLNNAGGAANPWTEEIPGQYTGTQAGKIIADIKTKANLIPGLY